MYDLGEQFKIDLTKGRANEKSIIQGQKYRITILSETLIRLEYNKNGVFNDDPTALVLNRNFKKPEFEVRQSTHNLEVITKNFTLTYLKEKPFEGPKINPMVNFKIELKGSDKLWHFDHPEVRNFGAPAFAFDSSKNKLVKEKGLNSPDGFVSIDDSNGFIFTEDGFFKKNLEDCVDTYVFIYKDDFEVCLKDYFELTGKPTLIPRYALGNWWTKNDEYNEKSLIELVDDFDYYDIPIASLVLNNKWYVHEKLKDRTTNGFVWDSSKFSDPKKVVDYLHSKGIRLGVGIEPTDGIYPYETYYNKAAEFLGISEGEKIPFNFYDPKYVDAYFKLLIHPLFNTGIDFVTIRTTDKKKEKDLWMINHYHYYDMNRDYKKRSLVLSRDPKVASHRYPITYSGKTTVSWDTLKMLPFYNSLAANKGVSFLAHDIGGYYKGVEDDELYTRFVQFGTFSPILKLGSREGKYYKREPWNWSVKSYTIAQDYLKLRHRMLPYLYSEAYKYFDEGKLLIRPIFFEKHELYNDINHKHQYFLGSQFYVSPIINKKEPLMDRVIHKFYVPEGIWYDFLTGKKFPGGKNYVSFYKDEDYPVFARAGSVIPFGENDNLNDTTPPKNMEIHVFPGMSNTYKLYEDDGVSNLYERGFYLKTDIEYNYLPSNYTVIIRAVEGKSGIVPDERNYKIKFRNTKRPSEVSVNFNGEELKFDSYNDGPDFIVEVSDVKTIGQLTINCKGSDIEIDAVRIINEDIKTIISDLKIETELKFKIDNILFGEELPLNKKRIAIRKLKRQGLERKFVKLFLKLLEYINQV